MKLPLEVVQINCAFHDDLLIFDDLVGLQKFEKFGLAYKELASASRRRHLFVMPL